MMASYKTDTKKLEIVRIIASMMPLLSFLAAIIYGCWFVQNEFFMLEKRLSISEINQNSIIKGVDEAKESIDKLEKLIESSSAKNQDRIERIIFSISKEKRD